MNNNSLQFKKYEEIKPFFQDLQKRKDLSEDKMSPFWKNYLDARNNFPDFNDILLFRRGMASGIGYASKIDRQSEFDVFLLEFGRAKAAVPMDFLIKNQESSTGLPYQYFKEGILSSTAGLHNCVSAYYIFQAINDTHFLPSKCILEIGAGYGGVADILIRNLEPDIYVICDLPQNLFLSAYYLTVNHPSYHALFIDKESPKNIPSKSLVFCTPAGVELFSNKFELVINTYSFQEMTMAEVNRYFNLISENLSENGLFYFLNTFGAAGAQKPTDYPFNLFNILSWKPYKVPETQLGHRKQHMEVLMSGKTGSADWPHRFKDISYVLSLLMFMGIDFNIVKCCDELIKGHLSENDYDYFNELKEVICSRMANDALKRTVSLNRFSNWSDITSYIAAILNLFDGNYSNSVYLFEDALKTGLAGFAKTKACLGLGLLYKELGNSKDSERYFNLAMHNMPQFESAIKNLQKNTGILFFKNSYKFAFPNMNIEKFSLLRKITKKL